MRKIKLIIISTIIIFGLIFAQNKAYAEITDDTIKLQKGSYFSKPLSFQSGDSLTITYRIGVIEGPHIDVFFFDSINFSYYKNNRPFSFIAGLSDEYTKYTNNEMRITIHDDYYLVFDNSDSGVTQPPDDNATAYVLYNVTAIPNLPDQGEMTDAETIDITIQKGNYSYKTLSFQSGDSLTVLYKMGVREGPPLDVYFFDSTNFSYFENNQPFSSIADLTDEYTRYTSNKFTVITHDDYYLVFDNSDKGATQPPNDNATAYISYQIMTIPLIPDNGNGGNINTPGFELIILIVAIAILLIKIKKKL